MTLYKFAWNEEQNIPYNIKKKDNFEELTSAQKSVINLRGIHYYENTSNVINIDFDFKSTPHHYLDTDSYIVGIKQYLRNLVIDNVLT